MTPYRKSIISDYTPRSYRHEPQSQSGIEKLVESSPHILNEHLDGIETVQGWLAATVLVGGAIAVGTFALGYYLLRN